MLIAVFWFGLVPFGCPVETVSAGPLLIGRSGIDFGDVLVRSQNETSLRIQNVSSHRIRIIGDGADCNCLSSQLSVTELEPFDLTDWNIRLNTCDYTGEVHRSVWLQTDDPKVPVIRLPVRYHVLPEIYTAPEFVPMGLVDTDDIEFEVAIYSTSEAPIQLFSPRASDPRIAVRLSQSIVMANVPATLHVHVSGGFTAEPFSAECFVETSSSEVERVRVPVFGEGATGIHCSVRELDFGSVPLGAAGEETIGFTTEPGVEVTDVRSADKDIEVRMLQRNDHGTCATIRTIGSLPLGAFHGTLFLETHTASGTRTVRFIYRGRVVERTVAVPDESASIQSVPAANLVGVS